MKAQPSTELPLTRQRGKFVGIVCRSLSLPFALVFLPFFSSQAQENASDGFQKADAELTSVYQQALTRFSRKDQEVLRRAERAWIVYSDREKALLESLRRENRLTEDALDKATTNEVDLRWGFLQEFYTLGKPLPNTTKTAVVAQEQQMQKAYDGCMRRLSGSDQALLRDAERAWIAFRDSDSVGTRVAYKTEGAVNLAGLRLACSHMFQLQNLYFYIDAQPIPPAPTPQIASREPKIVLPSPLIVSPTPEEIKAVADFREEAKGVVVGFLHKKDDPLFKVGDDLRKVPSLSPELTSHILKLQNEHTLLTRNPQLSKLLESAANESSAVSILTAWGNFTKMLKTDNPETAGNFLQSSLGLKPKDVTPDYLPLWKSIEGWRELYMTNIVKFQGHIKQAKYLAVSGKTSDAIKEYQAAYEIIEIPSIPEEIKKVRQQSLGL